MASPPPLSLLADEELRLNALRSYGILDTPPESSFDDLTALAALICETPIALISFVDEKRSWLKSKTGVSSTERSQDGAFCEHAIHQGIDEILEVPDATADPRFARNPLVTFEPHVRFYAGAPIVSPEGQTIGVLSVIDLKPRSLSPEQLESLKILSRHVVALMETRRQSARLVEETQRREGAEAALQEQARIRNDENVVWVESLREKEALLKEVHHRVKNNLQVITSLLRIEGRRIDHPVTQGVLDRMQGRIQSMALLHETLYRSSNSASVDLAAYLGQLSNQIFRSHVALPGTIRLHVDLEPLPMKIDQAIPCGLIVNELVSNSLKHAFPDGRLGDIWISLQPADDGARIVLSVSDNGSGLPADFDQKRLGSLGLQLVSDLARQLQGHLTIGPAPKAAFEVTFPRIRVPTQEIPRLPENA